MRFIRAPAQTLHFGSLVPEDVFADWFLPVRPEQAECADWLVLDSDRMSDEAEGWRL